MLYINSSFLFTDKYILLHKYTTTVVSIYLLMDIWMGLHWWLRGKESTATQETQNMCWEDPEESGREGGGRGDQDGEYM